MTDNDVEKPRVLVIGASGNIGGAVAAALEASSDPVIAVRATRREETAQNWRDEGKSAAYLDLDDPRTFPAALAGIDRVFLQAGYTAATMQLGTCLLAVGVAGA